MLQDNTETQNSSQAEKGNSPVSGPAFSVPGSLPGILMPDIDINTIRAMSLMPIIDEGLRDD